MDGWMDGEDLIICVALWTLYKRRAPLVSDDFRAVSIASRNQMRSRLHLFASRVDFGRTWEVQMEIKIYFWEAFRDAFAERVVESIFL